MFKNRKCNLTIGKGNKNVYIFCPYTNESSSYSINI